MLTWQAKIYRRHVLSFPDTEKDHDTNNHKEPTHVEVHELISAHHGEDRNYYDRIGYSKHPAKNSTRHCIANEDLSVHHVKLRHNSIIISK